MAAFKDKPSAPRIVLASRSPRRQELLRRIGIPDFVVDEANIDETKAAAGAGSCQEAVRLLALSKARAVALRHPDALVIGADTAVTIDGKILGKPRDDDDAFAMLSRLSGREHIVMSGVALCLGDVQLCRHEVSRVEFREIAPAEIYTYIEKEPPFDKAGAYGIQGLASLFIRRISGDYYTIMGLPLFQLGEMLRELDYRVL